MRFSPLDAKKSFKATWKTSSSFKGSLNASWGHNQNLCGNSWSLHLYNMFFIHRNCSKLWSVGSYMFDMFFGCNPGTKPGGGTSNGTAWQFCSPGTTAWIPAAQRIFHVPKPPIRQGRCLVAHQLKLPAVDGWNISLISSSKIIPSLKLRRCPWKLKVGTWNFLFGRQFRPILRDLNLRFMEVALLTTCLMCLFKVHPGYEGTMFQ